MKLNKLALLSAAVCAAMFAFSHNASANRIGGPGTFSGQTITGSVNTFASLPNANPTAAVSGTSTTIDLGAGGLYSYLFAKYDGQNDNSQGWYVGNLSGIVTIPAFGPGGILLPRPGVVPDGGATVMLLGAALGALAMARRFLMS
jgi:hypothetical protein